MFSSASHSFRGRLLLTLHSNNSGSTGKIRYVFTTQVAYSMLIVPHGSVCARLPNNNNPITDVGSKDIRCKFDISKPKQTLTNTCLPKGNANQGSAAKKCSVAAGDTVTVEMHQHNSRSCSEEAIGGAHHGGLYPLVIALFIQPDNDR